MKKIFSLKKIRKIEAQEFKKRGDSFSLMADAGTNCAKKIIKLIKNKPITIVAGKGNNAGDGFIIAEYLRKRNYIVKLYCFNKKLYKGDALKAFKKLKVKPLNILKFKFIKYSILIDCLFGTGLNRFISGRLRSIIFEMNKFNKIISIDISSGINGDTGKVLGCAVKANITLALHAKKIGQTLYPGKRYSGKILVVDIGISK